MFLTLLFSFLFISNAHATIPVEQINDMILEQKSFYEKLDNFSNIFVNNAEYINNPLGEENEEDPDPFYRFDAFDCQTFIETILSLSMATNFDNFLEHKKYISYYKGKIELENRNHFFEIDFVNNNKDLITDITDELGVKTFMITREIDKKSWFKKIYNIKKSERTKEISLKYIPWDANLLTITENFDKPSIIAIIIDDGDLPQKIGTNLLVGHLGLLFKTNHGLIIRHASSTNKSVTEESFANFVKRNSENPTKIGYKIYEINNYNYESEK